MIEESDDEGGGEEGVKTEKTSGVEEHSGEDKNQSGEESESEAESEANESEDEDEDDD